ncbi:13549_t:CDS:2 [Funneliformis geosporum]|uniref:13549_t:CDS:1 n=1 Tax=Funneliformis geosporum TaxID=1117311 RepID=A0A9W4SAZ0_9GLOM|nr:13549_t:CDS:2 [Funneliformis geosporum]
MNAFEVGKIIEKGDKCSKCRLSKTIDILNWEEVKDRFIKRGIETKQKAIKRKNNSYYSSCYCEAIVNRTPPEEQLLKDKKEKLAKLEAEKQQSQENKKPFN